MPKAKKKSREPHKIENAWKISRDSLELVWNKRKHFAVIISFYALAYLLATATASSVVNVNSIVNSYKGEYHGSFGGLFSGLRTFGHILSSLAGNNSPVSGIFQLVLFISLSLTILWSLKSFALKKKISARDAFYNSSTPLIPFFLILLLIAVEFLPILLAVYLYNAAVVTEMAKGAGVLFFWYLIFGLLTLLSFYLLTGTVMALYAVAVDYILPFKAIKSSARLVKGRRLLVFRKILFMPVAITIALGVIMLPVILIIPAASEWILFILVLIAILLGHTYMYNLNQEVKK